MKNYPSYKYQSEQLKQFRTPLGTPVMHTMGVILVLSIAATIAYKLFS